MISQNTKNRVLANLKKETEGAKKEVEKLTKEINKKTANKQQNV